MTLNRTNKFTNIASHVCSLQTQDPGAELMQFSAATRWSPHMLSLVLFCGYESVPMLARGLLTSTPESISMSTRFTITHRRSTHGADLLICAPGKGHFTNAANIEVASDRSNHDCLLAAARQTRNGGSFHRMDLLLGTLRRHVSTLTTIPRSLGSIRSCATFFALLTVLALGLRNSRRSTHTCQVTNLATFWPRFVRVKGVCRSVYLLSLIVKFASSFRSLATLA